jgi:hypothetical protein
MATIEDAHGSLLSVGIEECEEAHGGDQHVVIDFPREPPGPRYLWPGGARELAATLIQAADEADGATSP